MTPAARAALLWLAVLPDRGASAAPEEVEIVASRSGFRPKVVNLRRGETVRVRLSSADAEHCFALDAYRIEKRVVASRATLFDLTPDKAGTFPFYCCLESGAAAEAEHGRLVVTE